MILYANNTYTFFNSWIVVRFLALVTTMVTKVDGDHRSNDHYDGYQDPYYDGYYDQPWLPS